ncbi:MAG: hypothetical protein R2737_13510 [Candidatus Nanopelagicales bacterium]
MEFVYNLVLVLHFLGLASLIGGFLVQMSAEDKGVNPAMLHGALTQLVTGLIMVGMAETDLVDEDLDMAKIGTKLAIAAVVVVLAFVGRRRQPPQVGLWAAIGLLGIANVVIAVLWH